MISLAKTFAGMWHSASTFSKFTAFTLGAATASLALKKACGTVLSDTINHGATNLAGKVFSKTGIVLASAATVVGIGVRYLYNKSSDNSQNHFASHTQTNPFSNVQSNAEQPTIPAGSPGASEIKFRKESPDSSTGKSDAAEQPTIPAGSPGASEIKFRKESPDSSTGKSDAAEQSNNHNVSNSQSVSHQTSSTHSSPTITEPFVESEANCNAHFKSCAEQLTHMPLDELENRLHEIQIESDSRRKSRSTEASNSADLELRSHSNPIFINFNEQHLKMYELLCQNEITKRKEEIKNRNEIENLVKQMSYNIQNRQITDAKNLLDRIDALAIAENDQKWLNDLIFFAVKRAFIEARAPSISSEVQFFLQHFGHKINAELMTKDLINQYQTSVSLELFEEIQAWLKCDMSEQNVPMICLRTKFALLHVKDSIEHGYIRKKLQRIFDTGPVYLLQKEDIMTQYDNQYPDLRTLLINQLPTFRSEFLEKLLKSTPFFGLTSNPEEIFTEALLKSFDHKMAVVDYLKGFKQEGLNLITTLKLNHLLAC